MFTASISFFLACLDFFADPVCSSAVHKTPEITLFFIVNVRFLAPVDSEMFCLKEVHWLQKRSNCVPHFKKRKFSVSEMSATYEQKTIWHCKWRPSDVSHLNPRSEKSCSGFKARSKLSWNEAIVLVLSHFLHYFSVSSTLVKIS